MYWFNNDRAGKHKLINKIDHVITKLAKLSKMPLCDYVIKSRICDPMNVYKMQCLSFMYDFTHDVIILLWFDCIYNTAIHTHNTRHSSNLHINKVSSLEKRNFMQ
jgi:hypothetical protein